MPKKISFFDLDHTLLKGNGSFQFGVYLYKKGLIPTRKMLKLLGCYALHKWGVFSPERLNNAACNTFFSGKNINEIEKHVDSFLNNHLDDLFYFPVMKNLVDAHEQGHFTVILSSSPHFLVGPIAKRLGVDQWGATQYAIDESGHISHIESHMNGYAKALKLSMMCNELDIPIQNSTAYSDSYSDLPFLQAAGTAIPVNPDRKLRRKTPSKK